MGLALTFVFHWCNRVDLRSLMLSNDAIVQHIQLHNGASVWIAFHPQSNACDTSVQPFCGVELLRRLRGAEMIADKWVDLGASTPLSQHLFRIETFAFCMRRLMLTFREKCDASFLVH